MDLISRQEALEAMIRLATPMRDDIMGMIREAVIIECSDAINAVPSAQSEIIRCKKCKHWRSSDHTCREHSLVSPMMANDFCSKAERREE